MTVKLHTLFLHCVYLLFWYRMDLFQEVLSSRYHNVVILSDIVNKYRSDMFAFHDLCCGIGNAKAVAFPPAPAIAVNDIIHFI